MKTRISISLIVFVFCGALSGCQSAYKEDDFTMRQPLDLRDADQDGVVNVRDICADSPSDGTVDNQGCAAWQVEQVNRDFVFHFEFDKDDLKPEHETLFAGVLDLMRQKPEARILLVGDTSPEGSDEYNRNLGERRAEKVITSLTERGIARTRILGFVYSDELLEGVMKKRERRTIVRVQYVSQQHQPGWTIYTTEQARKESNP
ncbi:MAG: OmpA family protein [Pseudomonadota bacterium]|nr:OmpA family protein [Pseudomonadota bacterium]